MSPLSLLTLGGAILAEVIATSALKASEGFTRFWPSLITVIGYGLAFYLMALTLRTLPVGIVYGIWSAVGIVLISIVGWVVWDERLDTPALVGLGLIVAGVLVINVLSDTVRH